MGQGRRDDAEALELWHPALKEPPSQRLPTSIRSQARTVVSARVSDPDRTQLNGLLWASKVLWSSCQVQCATPKGVLGPQRRRSAHIRGETEQEYRQARGG